MKFLAASVLAILCGCSSTSEVISYPGGEVHRHEGRIIGAKVDSGVIPLGGNEFWITGKQVEELKKIK